MSNLKKILGAIVRLLLAAGAERWKKEHGPTLKVQALASMPGSPIAAVVEPSVDDPAPYLVNGPVAIPGSAPAVVVQAIPQSSEFSWSVALKKAGAQLWMLVLAAMVVALANPDFYKSLGLPEAAVTVIAALFTLLRDHIRHKEAAK